VPWRLGGAQEIAMKFAWRLVAGIIFVVLVAHSLDAAMKIDGLWYYYPTPEKQSVFIRNYSPEPVIEMFKFRNSNSASAGDIGSGAGRRFVTSERKFQGFIALDSKNGLPLMAAMGDDISVQLIQDGATILSRSGSASSGFHFTYRLGKSVGSATVFPLKMNGFVTRNSPLPEGIQDMTATVAISEKWFPKEESSIQASLVNR
jgi:hypothetical protein